MNLFPSYKVYSNREILERMQLILDANSIAHSKVSCTMKQHKQVGDASH